MASWMIFRVLMRKLCFLQGLLGSLLFTHTLSLSHLHLCSFLSYCWIILPSWGLMLSVYFYDRGGGWRVLLLLFNHPVLSDSLWPPGLQHARLPCPSPSPGACSNSCPLSRWCHPTISSSVAPSPPALNLSQHQGLCQWVGSLHQVAKVLELQLQHQSFQWTFRIDFL